MKSAIVTVAATLAFAAVSSGCGGSDQPVADKAPEPITASGPQIFADKCAVCHGARGEGGAGPRLNGGATVAKFPRSANEETLVRNGNKSMPSFGGSLTPEQISAVVAYSRGL